MKDFFRFLFWFWIYMWNYSLFHFFFYFCTAVSQSNWTVTESAAEWIIWSACRFLLSCWWDFWCSLDLYVSLLFDVLFQWNKSSALLHVLQFLLLSCIDRLEILSQILMSCSRTLWDQFCLFLSEWSLHFLSCEKQHAAWQLHILTFWLSTVLTQIFLLYYIKIIKKIFSLYFIFYKLNIVYKQ